ncbi:hypothetical protein [Listeria grandensis]|uniref:hypothetical protein n=1 Tax=Listeria grandensis TaxID=1494963 RepID=UPI00164DB62D|nr:hypothetical protein [Listeria grandensis]MBC6315071.1 hypothetical protein [Listeria grandensis]
MSKTFLNTLSSGSIGIAGYIVSTLKLRHWATMTAAGILGTMGYLLGNQKHGVVIIIGVILLRFVRIWFINHKMKK